MIEAIKKSRKIKIFFAVTASLIFVGVLSVQPFVQTTSASINVSNQLISFEYTNTQNGNSEDYPARISDDGRKIAFDARSTDIVASDNNGSTRDLIIRDIASSASNLINKTYQNVQTSQSVTAGPISENGRYVLFSTSQAGMTATSTSYNEIYIRDTVADTTDLVTINSSGSPADNTSSDMYGVSNDGRFVLFKSMATNFIDGVSSYPVPQQQIFMKDRVSGKIHLVSRSESGTNGNSGTNGGGSMSCDGSFIIFNSASSNLTPNDTNGKTDVFLVDIRNGFHIKNLTEGYNADSGAGSISCNGNYIVFGSGASNMPNAAGPGHRYMYERLTGDIHLVDQSTGGNVANSPAIGLMGGNRTVSDDGKVVFSSEATNLVSSHTVPPSTRYIYLRDTKNETTEIITVNSTGQLANASVISGYTSISKDGKRIAYSTTASNLVSEKSNTRSGVILATID